LRRPGALLAEIKRVFAARRYGYSRHAVRRAEERIVTPAEVEEALRSADAEVIADYPRDPRGPSCLIRGLTVDGRVLNVLVSYPPNVVVITLWDLNAEM
jgi:hypothetical protein